MTKNLPLLFAFLAAVPVAGNFSNAWAGEDAACSTEPSSTACAQEGSRAATLEQLPSTLAERQSAIAQSLSEGSHREICTGFEHANSFSSFKTIVRQNANGREIEDLFDSISCSFPVQGDVNENKSILYYGLVDQSKITRIADTIGYLIRNGVSNERLEAVLNRVWTYKTIRDNKWVYVSETFLDVFERRRANFIENGLGHRVEQIEGYISGLNLLRASEIAAADALPVPHPE